MNKLSRFIYWVLIFCITFANFAFLIKPEKAKAYTTDSLGFAVVTQTDPQFILPQPRELQITSGPDEPLTFVWKILRSEMKAHQYIKHYIVKFSADRAINCGQLSGVTWCNGDRNVTLKEDPFVHAMGVGSYEAYMEKGVDGLGTDFSDSPDYISYTLVNNHIKTKDLPDNTPIGAQSKGEETAGWDEEIFSHPTTVYYHEEDDPTQLGDAFSDANIEAYILDKMTKWPAEGNHPEEVRQNFANFMRKFKNTEDGWARTTMKKILGSPTQDPRFWGGFNEQDEWKNVLTEDIFHGNPFQNLKSRYFDLYDGSEAQYSSYLQTYAEEIQAMWDTDYAGSCADLSVRLSRSVAFSGMYAQIAGVLAGGLAAWFSGANPWITGAGAAIGYGLGTQIETAFREAQQDEATMELLKIVQKYVKILYSINYIIFKDVKVGLEKFKAEGASLDKNIGFNPYKYGSLMTRLEDIKKDLNECITTIKPLIDDLTSGLNTCGISFAEAAASFFLASALCAILDLLGSLTELLVNVFFTSIFEARDIFIQKSYTFMPKQQFIFAKQNFYWT